MMDAGWLNIASLVLGLLAWILPAIILLQGKKHDRWIAFTMMSISACAISLCLQIFSIYHLMKIEDWSALLDLMGALAVVSAILLVVTLILNTIVLIVHRGKKAK